MIVNRSILFCFGLAFVLVYANKEDDGNIDLASALVSDTEYSTPEKNQDHVEPNGVLPYHFKPETKDELFARIDIDNDQAVNLDDYMKRDRYYVESVKNEFNDIDANKDQKVTKEEFDNYIKNLEEQRRISLLKSSNFTLTRHDLNHDGLLSENELSTYINGTLQRSVNQLPHVFKEFDKDGDGKLNLNEFSELDFNFPWEKFPLNENAYRQVFSNDMPNINKQFSPDNGIFTPPNPQQPAIR